MTSGSPSVQPSGVESPPLPRPGASHHARPAGRRSSHVNIRKTQTLLLPVAIAVALAACSKKEDAAPAATGKDEVYVGRVRADQAAPEGKVTRLPVGPIGPAG